MLTTKEIKERLAEYGTLPNDLTTRLAWFDANPTPTIKVYCRECGAQMKSTSFSWEDVKREIELRGFLADAIGGYCDRCAPPDEES